MFSISMASAKAEEGQDRQNHDDESDEIYKTVHKFAPCTRPVFLNDNLPEPTKFPRSGKRSNTGSILGP